MPSRLASAAAVTEATLLSKVASRAAMAVTEISTGALVLRIRDHRDDTHGDLSLGRLLHLNFEAKVCAVEQLPSTPMRTPVRTDKLNIDLRCILLRWIKDRSLSAV